MKSYVILCRSHSDEAGSSIYLNRVTYSPPASPWTRTKPPSTKESETSASSSSVTYSPPARTTTY